MSSAPLIETQSLRRALHWVGSGLALISLVFVAFRLQSYWLDLDFSRFGSSAWGQISVYALIYGVANFLLALAWWHLLVHLGASVTRINAFRIYGISQLAKYIPGNIFHLAGRQALGMATGMAAGVLAKSIILELGTLAVAGSLLSLLLLPVVLPDFLELEVVFLLVGSVILITALSINCVGRQPVWTFGWQMLFLVISGAIFVASLDLIADAEDLSFRYWLIIGSAYIAAWLIGLLTPGAPAGLGVRELILLLLLKGLVAEADLILAILLGRLVTVVGDLLFFVTASWISAKTYKIKAGHA